MNKDLEPEQMLAELLTAGVVFINNGWWKKEEGLAWPEDAITLHVNCNDIFAWGCADAEDLLHDDIAPLYTLWLKDPDWGAAAFCIQKRKSLPQLPVIKIMETKYDLNALIEETKQ